MIFAFDTHAIDLFNFGSISLKLSLETRLEPESFEALIDFLEFQVQTL